MSTATPGPVPIPTPAALFAAINAARLTHDRPALARDTTGGDEVAQGWAEGLAEGGELAHGDFAGRIWSVHPGTVAAEDIGEAATVEGVVGAWIASPAHRAILLGDWATVGVGLARGDGGELWAVADFDRAIG